MNLTLTVLKAAKAAKVSGSLLLAICSHESANFTQTYAAHDNGSPSIGICQLKAATAQMLGFKGTVTELMKPETNAQYAAEYLKYQQIRYGSENWCKLVSAYNAGSYNESTISPGYPKNLKYVRRVQNRLSQELRTKLACGGNHGTR